MNAGPSPTGYADHMPDLLDTVRRDIDARLAELRPLVQEASRLQSALDALATTDGRAQAPTASRARGPRQSRRGASRGETRARIVDYVQAHPGSTAGDVARALGLNRQSTSTRLTQLAKAGEIAKAKRGYGPSA
jgi:CRP-like cAMP-binding protein